MLALEASGTCSGTPAVLWVRQQKTSQSVCVLQPPPHTDSWPLLLLLLPQNIARRNSLLTHTSAALRQLQHQLDAVDAFVRHHFTGPWEGVGLKDAGRHWLDTVAR